MKNRRVKQQNKSYQHKISPKIHQNQEGDEGKIGEESNENVPKTSRSQEQFTVAEKIVIFLIVLFLTSIFSMIQYFAPKKEIFPHLTKNDQPVCSVIDESLPSLGYFLNPVIFSLLSVFISNLGGNFLIAITGSVFYFLCDSQMSLLYQSPSITIVTFLVILSYIFIQDVLSVNFSTRWLLNFFFSYLFVFLAVFLRPECLGPAVGVFAVFIVSAISQVGAYLGYFVRMSFQALKVFGTMILYGIILSKLVFFLWEKYGSAPIDEENFDLAMFIVVFQQFESRLFMFYLVLSILLFNKPKYGYDSIVQMVGSIIGAAASLVTKAQSKGYTYELKLILINIQVFFASIIVFSKLNYKWAHQGILIILAMVAFFIKIGKIISSFRR